jgi:hypothetical protein
MKKQFSESSSLPYPWQQSGSCSMEERLCHEARASDEEAKIESRGTVSNLKWSEKKTL